MTHQLEKITTDNRRPGMPKGAKYLIRHSPSLQHGWLCCRCFTTRKDAILFAKTF